MQSEVFLLILSFFLTSVVGGLLGYYFQNRSWKHQNTAHLQESESLTAKNIFENISMLMDKRLYRSRLLSWSLEDETPQEVVIEKHMTEYRQTLYEWNDTLIRNLALVEAYFGNNIRQHLEGTIYESFQRIGKLLENQYADWKISKKGTSTTKTSIELKKLGDEIYRLNFSMIKLIQSGKVGVFNADEKK